MPGTEPDPTRWYRPIPDGTYDSVTFMDSSAVPDGSDEPLADGTYCGVTFKDCWIAVDPDGETPEKWLDA